MAGGYNFGRSLGKNWPYIAGAVVLLVVAYIAAPLVMGSSNKATVDAGKPALAPIIPESSLTPEQRCQPKVTNFMASAQASLTKSEPDKAIAVINGCQQFLAGEAQTKLYASVVEAARKKDEKERKELAAKRKKEGVKIGMTREEVLGSNWGKPTRVNKTTTANGTREQWVYESGNYLYFNDGVLTAIQN